MKTNRCDPRHTNVEIDIVQLKKQCADLRALVEVLGRRLRLVEARPISWIGSSSPRVIDYSLEEEFDVLYAQGETINENQPA